MSFAICGSHRSGKSTLAKQVAEDLGYHFHDASVSKIMKAHGINAVGDVSLAERIGAQEFLLEKYIENLAWAPRPMITDRTPLDMIGYMLGEVTMHNSGELGERVDAYVTTCLGATVKYFDTIMIVRPLPVYVVDSDKPPPSPAYQSLIQFIIEGAARQIDGSVYCHTILTSDFQARRQGAAELLVDRMVEIAAEAKTVKIH